MLCPSFLEWRRRRRSSWRSAIPAFGRGAGSVWSFVTGFGKVCFLAFNRSIALALRASLQLASRPIHVARNEWVIEVRTAVIQAL
jgi:hypothetical protein